MKFLFKMRYVGLIFLTIFFTASADFFTYLNYAEDYNFSTYLIVALSYFVIFITIYIYSKNISFFKKLLPKKINNIFSIWILLLIINLIRGVVLADDYWSYKFLFLTSLPFTFICLVYYTGTSIYFFRYNFLTFLKRFMLVGFLLIPLTLTSNPELYSRLMIPISIYILFIPYFKLKWKILVIAVAVTSVLMFLDFRTNIVKIGISLLILPTFYFHFLSRKLVLNVIHKIFFLAPIIFLLITFNNINIFKLIESRDYEIKSNNDQIFNLTTDTRSFLYTEVINTFESSSQLIFGLGSSGHYKSIWFYDTGGAMDGRRFRTEVNILNILLYHGILGVILFLVLLYKVSYLAINNSNNKLSQMLGILIASRWFLSFIEEFTQFDLNFYFFWLILGVISSNSFRSLTDYQIKNFINAKSSSTFNLS